MIASEEKSLLVEQDTMAFRVARRRNGQKPRSQLPRPFAFENDFRTGLRRQFIPMNNTAGAIMLGITLSVLGH